MKTYAIPLPPDHSYVVDAYPLELILLKTELSNTRAKAVTTSTQIKISRN